MAITSTLSNHYKFQILSGNIDFDSDTFKMALMNTAFSFDKDSHPDYVSVSGSELGAGNGYDVGGKTMTGVSLQEDDNNDRGRVTWSNVQWDATGGQIGPTGAAILYDDTSADKTVIGCIDFDTDYTISDGSSLQLQNIAVNNT